MLLCSILLALFVTQTGLAYVLPDVQFAVTGPGAWKQGLNRQSTPAQDGTKCPTSRSLMPTSVKMLTKTGGTLSRLPVSINPDGTVLSHHDDTDLSSCLSLCRTSAECQGLIWICKESSSGSCLLYKDVSGPMTWWTCTDCVGYSTVSL
jgi:hypothetical protein